jgi:hypothetical protein
MIKFYTASYDASVYLQQPVQNAGRDPILEIAKTYYGNIKDINRSLIKFDILPISKSLASGEISGSFRSYLNLQSARSEKIPAEYTIYANAVSESWDMGQFTRFDSGSTSLQLSSSAQQGVSWRYRNGINKWQENAIAGTAVYAAGVTGSANAEGGVWYTASQASQSYSYQSDDIHMDITDIVKMWVSGTIVNNGLILRHGLSNENDTKDYGTLRFYSKETDTIYQPNIEFVWETITFTTGSLLPVTGSALDDYKVILTNLKTKYEANTKPRIRVKGRDKFPLKTFGTTFEYDQSKYLPQTTYYQLEDYVTGETIYPFSDYTKLSCDSISNYFDLELSTLSVYRTYRIKIKIVKDGVSTILDDKLIFEIV